MTFTTVTSKVVLAQVAPGREVLARRGAMLAVTGRVTFSPVAGGPGGGAYGGGLAASLARGVQGEAVALMVAEGSGAVHYGFHGHHVTVIELDGSRPLSVEADRLLAHDASLSSSVVFLGQQGGLRGAVRGAVTGQGMFTTQLSGRGSVAVLSHGGTFALPVSGGRQVVVDPQAYVAHEGDLRVDVAAAVSWRDAVGRGSGEAVQLRVSGEGTVHVQASEEKL
ncbi:AIM24 family protein [Paenibacillus sp. TRM 82003]|uniref:AIM24 family protein n=1 Tax=Kineococcus sp. TRM81007 TaxID=2925831 RepID=UPI001F5845CD|nr:AIM24 family protein [Kineococcus sp. TRM81007]MCI2237696.1 AIM24 family protein [Kineococcus sp. TRM81007]MCI3921714.1 AIM24 family protein [Paenibacillus sp. TRM 82003]